MGKNRVGARRVATPWIHTLHKIVVRGKTFTWEVMSKRCLAILNDYFGLKFAEIAVAMREVAPLLSALAVAFTACP